MPAYYNPESRPLTMEEMTVNSEYILGYLLPKGWTRNAICGMLGNMQSESAINPARWEGDKIGVGPGFGLVQWTPFSKYMDWVAGTPYAPTSMEGNLERIEWEVANNQQWIKTSDYPLTFQEFKVSDQSPEYLAQAFIRNYERPANPDQPARSTQARYWWDNLSGSGTIGDGGGSDPNPTTTNQAIYHLWLSHAMRW